MAEHAKGKCVQIAEPAAVKLIKIAVRYFAFENSFRTLCDRSLIVWDPSAREQSRRVDSAQQPDKDEYPTAAARQVN